MARIALDASGGDYAPTNPVKGALEALTVLPDSCEIVLVGPEAEVRTEVERHGPVPTRLSIVDAPESIGMAEKPLAAVRSKRKSSIVVGMDLHKRGEVDAFISAGNTGAVMAASAIILGVHEGVDRPAIGTVLPSPNKPPLLIDAGANVDCSAKELFGFARLGAVYARDVLKRPNPAVGLLNIGEESEKGNAAAKEANGLLQGATQFQFVGNIEGGDIISMAANGCDVIVCDGFVGNIVLKFYEAVGRSLADLLQRELEPAVLKDEPMRRVFKFLDYSSYGGAPLLGVRGVPVICHGRSTPAAIRNALRVALQSVDGHLSAHIHDEFATTGVVTS